MTSGIPAGCWYTMGSPLLESPMEIPIPTPVPTLYCAHCAKPPVGVCQDCGLGYCQGCLVDNRAGMCLCAGCHQERMLWGLA